MKLKTCILILTALCLSFLFSCGNGKEIKLDKPSGTATITLNDGEELDFETTFTTNASLMDRKFAIGLSNSLNGMLIYIMIMSNETLAPGTHDGYISVKQIGNSNTIDETYNSHYYKGTETNNEGNSKLTITSMEDDSVQGTFSGILYSETGKKLSIKNGAFNIKIENEL
jgi:hypothetical protein